MSLAIGTVDKTTLPTALLPRAKAHCRIDFSRDDALLTEIIARAIEKFENETEAKVFAATFQWSPAGADFVDGRARSPISPVLDFTADVGETNVKDSYSVVTNSAIQGAGTYYLVGAWQDGLGLTLTTGYTDAAAIPAGIINEIMLYTATFYENRELFLSGGTLNPLGLRQQVAGWWLPKA